MAERRDKRGRRIGRNWWREMNWDLWFYATTVWHSACEAVAFGYETETAEYTADHPLPTFKSFLLANAGMNQPREEET
jgi:hypothetical protein